MIELTAIGKVESPLTDPAAAPKQGDEGAPEATLVFEPRVADGLEGIVAGDELIVLTWLDRADRAVLRVHPRDDLTRPQQGVFTTRSSDRPNPIGLHGVASRRATPRPRTASCGSRPASGGPTSSASAT